MRDKHRCAAIMTIHKPGRMTAHGRRDIAAWLRRTASDLIRLGHRYTDTGPFRARYFYGVLIAILLTGCAMAQPLSLPAPGTADVALDAPADGNPFDLLRTNPLLTSALVDSDRTLAWIDAHKNFRARNNGGHSYRRRDRRRAQ